MWVVAVRSSSIFLPQTPASASHTPSHVAGCLYDTHDCTTVEIMQGSLFRIRGDLGPFLRWPLVEVKQNREERGNNSCCIAMVTVL